MICCLLNLHTGIWLFTRIWLSGTPSMSALDRILTAFMASSFEKAIAAQSLRHCTTLQYSERGYRRCNTPADMRNGVGSQRRSIECSSIFPRSLINSNWTAQSMRITSSGVASRSNGKGKRPISSRLPGHQWEQHGDLTLRSTLRGSWSAP